MSAADDRFDLADFDELPQEPLDWKKIARALSKPQRRDIAWQLDELRQYYLRERNPLYALEAIRWAYLFGLPPPRWASRHIALAPLDVAELQEATAAGAPLATAVGRALGFGSRGRHNWLDRTRLGEDREIFWQVRERMQGGEKRYIAYNTVARARGVATSTVQKAVVRYLSARRAMRK